MRGAINNLNEQIVGSTLVFLDGDRVDIRNNETNLGAHARGLRWHASRARQLHVRGRAGSGMRLLGAGQAAAASCPSPAAHEAAKLRLCALAGNFACDSLEWFVSNAGTGIGGGNVLDAYPGVPTVCLLSGGSLR